MQYYFHALENSDISWKEYHNQSVAWEESVWTDSSLWEEGGKSGAKSSRIL